LVERPTTRAEAMALSDERKLVEQGYEFLDEKRVILAGEIMARLSRWRSLEARRDQALHAARDALAAAIRSYGLEAVQLAPVASAADAPVFGPMRFLGVRLLEAKAALPPAPAGMAPGPLLDRIAATFGTLHGILAEMAPVAVNLFRLADEYRSTERKAKALENILLPEIDADLRRIEAQLEALEQEDAIRVHNAARAATRG
jgi:V/A-type H+-transporting ATPase subunit D